MQEVFSVFAFVAGLIYWNLRVTTTAVAGISYTWNGSSDSLWSNQTTDAFGIAYN
ncbi:MAG: hypothetical protein IPJ86_05460 [Bacteroidetes bacterium]|nr:hypothetical protein [Bacteroidota bacterium]